MRTFRVHSTAIMDRTRHSMFAVFALITSLVLGGALFAPSVEASHSWGNYHWARQTNPFTLKLSSNLTPQWQPYLVTTSNDWSASNVVDTVIVPGTKNAKTCRPTIGQVEVCNAKYGSNGWLGLAQIWLSGNHITQGTTKLNDTYFQLPRYNTVAERNHVMCQEVGHTFGLGHQDESGVSLGTCMDYSMDSSSQHPNAHDYEELELIYAHLDSTNTVSLVTSGSSAQTDPDELNNSQNWGRRVFRSQNGYLEAYERKFADGTKLISFVILAK